MFKHILVPTDGSALSEGAALKSIQLARALGARVTGVHVSPQFHVLTYRTEMLEDTRDEYERDSRLHAERYLAPDFGKRKSRQMHPQVGEAAPSRGQKSAHSASTNGQHANCYRHWSSTQCHDG